MVGGDYNAKHHSWGCHTNNPRGIVLYNFINLLANFHCKSLIFLIFLFSIPHVTFSLRLLIYLNQVRIIQLSFWLLVLLPQFVLIYLSFFTRTLIIRNFMICLTKTSTLRSVLNLPKKLAKLAIIFFSLPILQTKL